MYRDELQNMLRLVYAVTMVAAAAKVLIEKRRARHGTAFEAPAGY